MTLLEAFLRYGGLLGLLMTTLFGLIFIAYSAWEFRQARTQRQVRNVWSDVLFGAFWLGLVFSASLIMVLATFDLF